MKASAAKATRLRALPPWRRVLEEQDQAWAEPPPIRAGGGALNQAWAEVAPGKAGGGTLTGAGGGTGTDPTAGAGVALAWIHGYRGHDSRSNAFFSADGDAVYPAAAVVVVAGAAEEGGKRRQRFFRGHSDDVLALARHPERTVFASGQKASHECRPRLDE